MGVTQATSGSQAEQLLTQASPHCLKATSLGTRGGSRTWHRCPQQALGPASRKLGGGQGALLLCTGRHQSQDRGRTGSGLVGMGCMSSLPAGKEVWSGPRWPSWSLPHHLWLYPPPCHCPKTHHLLNIAPCSSCLEPPESHSQPWPQVSLERQMSLYPGALLTGWFEPLHRAAP